MVVGDRALARHPQERVIYRTADGGAHARNQPAHQLRRLLFRQLDAQSQQQLGQELRQYMDQPLTCQPVAHAAQAIDARRQRQHLGQMRLLLNDARIVAVGLCDVRGHAHGIDRCQLHVRTSGHQRPQSTGQTGDCAGEHGAPPELPGKFMGDLVHLVEWQVVDILEALHRVPMRLVRRQHGGIAPRRPVDRLVDALRCLAGLEQVLHLRRQRSYRQGSE